MDLYSNVLENMLVAEQTKAADDMVAQSGLLDTETALQKEPEKAEGAAKRVAEEHSKAVESPISSYWYLDDDTTRANQQFSDRIMEKLLSVMIVDEVDGQQKLLPMRTAMQKERPPFSMSVMNTNSTQLAQKASPMFEGFDAIFMCFSWHNPYYTVGILLLITHAILKPQLFALFLPAFILVRYMFPSYLRLYPSDNTFVDGRYLKRNPFPHTGKALGKFKSPKPAPMYSKEYLMNFTDMQNHIVPYIRLHDSLIEWGQHYFLFEDQKLSTIVFLILLFLIGFNLYILPIVTPLILRVVSIQAILIALTWAVFISSHPVVNNKILDLLETEEARLARLDRTDKAEKYLMTYISDAPEDELKCELEIFELQQYNLTAKAWKPVGYTKDFYSLNHPDRILKSEENDGGENDLFDAPFDEHAEPRVVLVATLSEIRAPLGWKFVDSRWSIDLDPHLWVVDNCIMDLVSVDDEEKWVYDAVVKEDEPAGNIYRRRRWYRYSQRQAINKKGKEKAETEQQDLHE